MAGHFTTQVRHGSAKEDRGYDDNDPLERAFKSNAHREPCRMFELSAKCMMTYLLDILAAYFLNFVDPFKDRGGRCLADNA